MHKNRLRAQLAGFLFVLPAVTIVGLLLLYPVVTSLFYSFTSKHLIKPAYEFVWFDNYIKSLSQNKGQSGIIEQGRGNE